MRVSNILEMVDLLFLEQERYREGMDRRVAPLVLSAPYMKTLAGRN
jgi:hypothetical protein